MEEIKYYIYISDTKVNSLYDQIESSLKDKISSELKIDLKLLSVSLLKPPEIQNRYSKTKIVAKYLRESGLVGSVTDSKPYVDLTMHAYWTYFLGKVAYFSGITNRTLIGLGGASYFMLSNNVDQTRQLSLKEEPEKLLDDADRFFIDSVWGSDISSLHSVLANIYEKENITYHSAKTLSSDNILTSLDKSFQPKLLNYMMYFHERLSADVPSQKIQVLTRKMRLDKVNTSTSVKWVMLGSPIYVSYAD